MDPSSATVGEGVVWIGNRGNNQPSGYDAKTLSARGVVHLPTIPDGLAYSKATHELWATTPADETITSTGVDNPEYDAARRLFFIAAGADGEMVIAHADDGWPPSLSWSFRHPAVQGQGVATSRRARGLVTVTVGLGAAIP